MTHREEVTIVAFGDSITAATAGDWPEECRWVTRVEGGLRALFPSRPLRIVNAGVGGNTVREGWARFERDVAPYRPSAVLIEFGGNDATPDPDRRVVPKEFTDLLVAVIERCREINAHPILLTFPPVVDHWHAFWRHEAFREAGGQDRYIETYRALTRTTAVCEEVPPADIDCALRRAMARFGTSLQVMPDGVHLTPAGNLTVALEVLRVLAQWMTHYRE